MFATFLKKWKQRSKCHSINTKSVTGSFVLILTFHPLNPFSHSIFHQNSAAPKYKYKWTKAWEFCLELQKGVEVHTWTISSFLPSQNSIQSPCLGEANYIKKGTKLSFYLFFNLLCISIFVKSYFGRLLVVTYVSITCTTNFTNF